jgi:hypothetical protein
MYRPSVKITSRLEARPHRQPLLDFADDDELVAACCGFEDVEHLARFRLMPHVNAHLFSKFTGLKLQPEQINAVLNLLRIARNDTEPISTQDPASPSWSRQFSKRLSTLVDLHGGRALDHVTALHNTTAYLQNQPTFRDSHRLYNDNQTIGFDDEPFKRLPKMSRQEIKQTALPNLDEDTFVEACLKAALLIENIKIL